MKALPMLDHVMLWVARTLAIIAFLGVICIDMELSHISYRPFYQYLIGLIPYVTAIVGLWSLNQPCARIYLGAVAAFFVIFAVGTPFYHLFHGEKSALAFVYTFCMSVYDFCFSVLVTSPFFWVAFRPPNNKLLNPVNLENPV